MAMEDASRRRVSRRDVPAIVYRSHENNREKSRKAKSTGAPRGARAHGVVSIVFIAALLVLGNWACRSRTPTESSARPLGFTPGSGPIEGNRFVFIDVEESAAAIGTARLACQFGQHAASPGEYDATSARYLCRAPAQSRPESVTLTITLDGAEFRMPERYVYTTRGKNDAPVTEVDVPTFQRQVKRVRDLIPRGVALCAVLKNGEPVGWLGDAMARAAKVDYFCVPNAQDGIALREAGVDAPIMVLYLTEASYAPVLLHYGLEPAAYSLAWVDEANRLLQRARGKLKVHLWIDTGLSREGVMPDDALALARAVNKSPKLQLQGIATHFCCLDKADLAAIEKGNLDNQTALQKHRFDEVVKAIHAEGIGLDAIIHAGVSDTLRLGLTPLYYNMLRIGGMLWENPSPEHRNYMWKTRILQVKTLPKGWCIDYGCDVTAKVDTRVGLVAHVPNDEVTYLVRGERAKKLLDHGYVIILDISHLPDVREGEEVTMVLPDEVVTGRPPVPNSPLDSSWSEAPVTLRDGAGPGKDK
jgi:alanine racemase